jgi:hypothetical protein
MGYATALEWYDHFLSSFLLDSFLLFLIGFPETIDKLEPEIGETGGPKPVIFGAFVIHPRR